MKSRSPSSSPSAATGASASPSFGFFFCEEASDLQGSAHGRALKTGRASPHEARRGAEGEVSGANAGSHGFHAGARLLLLREVEVTVRVLVGRRRRLRLRLLPVLGLLLLRSEEAPACERSLGAGVRGWATRAFFFFEKSNSGSSSLALSDRAGRALAEARAVKGGGRMSRHGEERGRHGSRIYYF